MGGAVCSVFRFHASFKSSTLVHFHDMLSISRSFFPIAARVALTVGVAAAFGGCSLFHSDDAAAPEKKKKGWSILPWGGKATGGDATGYIEYQRSKSDGSEPLYTLTARNTHMTRSIEGQMRTTMQTTPNDMKMDNQSFTLGPNEVKKLLIYPARFPLTYEVTASFKD